MGTQLPIISVAGATVGQTFTIDFTQFVKQSGLTPGSTTPAHIRVFNESGVGFNVSFKASGRADFMPAGAWPVYELDYNDSTIVLTVALTLPNPPVSSIIPIYYKPGEPVPDTPQLGNSPIGIGGTVNTSSVNFLSDEGRAKTQLTIDIGDSVLANLINIFNDGTATFKVDVTGVAHTLITLASAANFLKLGQAGDTTEVVGALAVDQAINPNTASFTVLNGSVSGTCTLWMPFQGSAFKMVIMNMVNFQHASNNSFGLPVGFTLSVSALILGDLGVSTNGGLQFLSGAVAQSSNILTVPAAAGGTGVSQIPLYKFTLAQVSTAATFPIDHIQTLANTTAHAGMAFFIGI